MVDEVLDGLGHAFSETAWAEASPLAAISDWRLIGAARAKGQDETVLEDSAFQEITQLFGDALRHGAAFGFAVGDKRLDIRC